MSDDGLNPEAETWIDPNLAKNVPVEAEVAVVVDPAREHLDKRVAQLRSDGIIPGGEAEAISSEEAEQAPSKKPKKSKSAKAAGAEEKEAETKKVLSGLELLLTKENDFRTKQSEAKGVWAEQEARVKAFEAARESASSNPLAALEAQGFELNDENLQRLAKAAYNKSLGDLAPPEIKAQGELAEMRREIQQLKEQGTAKEAAAKAAQEQAVNDTRISEYNTGFVAAVQATNPESNPMISSFLASENMGPDGVVADMWHIANAMNQETGTVPAPSEVAARLELEYKSRFGHLVNPNDANKANEVADPETTPTQNQPRTLRNAGTKAQVTAESLDSLADANGDPEAYRKIVKIARARAEAKWKRDGLVK
jgi:hypothetical protein